MTVSAVRHVSIFIRDMERSLKLYRDILGLKVYFDETFQNNEMTKHIAVADHKVHVVFLEADQAHMGMIALFDIIDEEALGDQLPPAPPTPSSVQPGHVAVVFYCDDLDATHARLTEEGYAILQPPTELPGPKHGSTREMTCWDPDGVLINLIQN